MRHLVFAMIMTMTTSIFAQDLPGEEVVPDYMRDGTITVTLKNGKTYNYSTNEWKVVRRGSKKAPVPVIAARKDTELDKQDVTRKNRITLLGGAGYGNLNLTETSTMLRVSDRMRPVFGLSYTRDISQSWHLTGAALTNESYLLGAGLQY